MADSKIADRELMRVEFHSLQARVGVLELRVKSTEEELADIRRQLEAFDASLGGLVNDND